MANAGKAVWCVKHNSGWCATKHGRRPDPEARSDETRCGHVVTLRIGADRREPDCPECRAKMGLTKKKEAPA